MFVIYFEDDNITEEHVDFFGDFQEVCPGCGCKPGDGLTENCNDELGCNYWRKLQGESDFEIAVLNDDELIDYFDGRQVLGWQTLDDIKKVMFEVAMLPKQ